MFRIKLNLLYITLSVICLLLISGCSNKNKQSNAASNFPLEEMLLTDTIKGDDSSTANAYKTTEVINGDIVATNVAMSSISFPISYDIYHEYDYGTVTFVSFSIKDLGFSYISEGDTIAVMRLNIEPIAKEEARINYEKALQSYETALERKTDALNDILEDIEKEKNTYLKQILELDYEAARKEYDLYIIEQQEYIEKLHTTMELYSQESSEIYLTSPCNGIINRQSFASLNTGDIVEPGTIIATVQSLEKALITTTADFLNYGDDVEIIITSSTQITLNGKVISSKNILRNVNTNTVTIAITSELPDFSLINTQSLRQIVVKSVKTPVSNGLLIPRASLMSYNGNTGTVYVYNNGAVTKTNIKVGYRSNDFVWILEGLKLGQEVTIK